MTTKILIVEDEAVTALDIKLNLEDLGYEIVAVVDNAIDALNIAAEKSPDLTIMDIQLKGDITGIEVAELIAELDLPVIYLTANTDITTFTNAMVNVPSYAFIGKPFDKRVLKRNVEIALNRSRIESEKINLAHGFVKD